MIRQRGRPWLAVLLTAGAVASAGAESLELDAITVTASKSERPASEIAAPITVITDEEIERIMAEDIADLVRYEPGVTVPFQGQRFGLSGFTIRGLGGNRVQVLMDGVRISDAFAIGDFANAARNFVDVDTLKQAEILRGPSSSLFGSNALGGVVAMTTRDPADWLRAVDGNITGRVRGGYYNADAGWVASATTAAAGERWSGMLHYVERRGSELDNQGGQGGTGPARTQPNPHDYTGRNLLAKLMHGEGGASQWRLTVEGNRADSETAVLNLVRTQDFTAIYGFPYVVDTTRLDGDDRAQRQRISLDHRLLGSAIADRLAWRVYWQDSETRQDTFEERNTIINGRPDREHRYRRALFEQQLAGVEANAQWTFNTGALRHDLVAGVELLETRTEQSRDGRITDPVTGETSNVVGPDRFPVRDFPNSAAREIAIYAEDRLQMGRLTLIPGLRLDHYRLRPRPDAIFIEDNPGIDPVRMNETSLTPRLGAILSLTEGLEAFGQYARGFRSPPYNDVNVGFTNLQFGYTAIPNPDLKSERSEGVELGLRGRGRGGSFSLSAYENRYRDFIESFVSLGVDPESGLLVFQSQNLTRVRIRGAEARGVLNLGVFSAALDDWRLRTAAAWSRGDDRARGVPLNSVDPLNGVVGLQWQPAALPLEVELALTAVARKTRVDGDDPFRPGGYAVLDLLAGWHITDTARLRAGLFNLTDRKYWAWSEVRGRDVEDPALDRYTRPGRNVGVSLAWQF